MRLGDEPKQFSKNYIVHIKNQSKYSFKATFSIKSTDTFKLTYAHNKLKIYDILPIIFTNRPSNFLDQIQDKASTRLIFRIIEFQKNYIFMMVQLFCVHGASSFLYLVKLFLCVRVAPKKFLIYDAIIL